LRGASPGNTDPFVWGAAAAALRGGVKKRIREKREVSAKKVGGFESQKRWERRGRAIGGYRELKK